VPDWVSNYLLPGLDTLIGTHATNQASDAMAGAYQNAIDEQRRQFDQSRTDLMPWLTAGTGALNQLSDPTKNFLASPDYEFRRSEGTRDIGNSFAAKGGSMSGNALRRLDEFNSGLAGGEFGNWWNRQAGLAGVGQTTATNLGQLGANTAGNVGNFLAGQGDARASGLLNRGGILAGNLNTAYRNYLYGR
jgi:hypothetical protein